MWNQRIHQHRPSQNEKHDFVTLTGIVILFIVRSPQALIPPPFNLFRVLDTRVIVGSLFTFLELLFSKSRVVVTLIEAFGPLILSGTSFSTGVVDKAILIKA